MPYKKPRVSKPKYRKYAKNPKRYVKKTQAKKFAKKVMSVVNRNAEVKEALYENCVNLPLRHNTVQCLNSNVLGIQIGFNGQSFGGTPGTRIGNKIFVKSIQCAINLESQQYRPSVNYWLYLVKRKGTAVPSTQAITDKDAMFEGTSTTIPCDYIDKQKVDVIWCKKLNPRMPNMGTLVNLSNTSTVGTGVLDQASGTAWTYDVEDYKIMTNPQIQAKFYVPINRLVTYMDAQDTQNTPVGFGLQWVICSYDNYTTITGDTIAPCGHITMTQKVRFTDV